MEEGHEEAVLNGTISRLDPPRLLEIDSDIFGQLRFELFAENDGCLLRFSDTFESPPDMLAQSMAGWHMHLEHLEQALDGEGVTNWDTWSEDYLDAWAEIRDRYEAAIAAGALMQAITPCLMFVGDQHGRAEEAIELYVSVFEDSRVLGHRAIRGRRGGAGGDGEAGEIRARRARVPGHGQRRRNTLHASPRRTSLFVDLRHRRRGRCGCSPRCRTAEPC